MNVQGLLRRKKRERSRRQRACENYFASLETISQGKKKSLCERFEPESRKCRPTLQTTTPCDHAGFFTLVLYEGSLVWFLTSSPTRSLTIDCAIGKLYFKNMLDMRGLQNEY